MFLEKKFSFYFVSEGFILTFYNTIKYLDNSSTEMNFN